MIVKEDDLIDLFQNYTLNVNISDKPEPFKKVSYMKVTVNT